MEIIYASLILCSQTLLLEVANRLECFAKKHKEYGIVHVCVHVQVF